MMLKRRNHDAAFKARVALEALKGEHMVSELATSYGVHPTLIHQSTKALLDGSAGIFGRGGKATASAELAEDTVRDPHAKMGELVVANDFFCHESSSHGPGSDASNDRARPSGAVDRGETEANLGLMLLSDKQFLDTPFYGVADDFTACGR